MEKIAFVILTWNSEKYIQACLESVFSLENYQVTAYVVDNGSQDRTTRIIQAYQNQLKKTNSLQIILNRKNLGTTISRNMALKKISPETDYICILDSDTIINQNAIDRLIWELTHNRKIGVIGPTMVREDGAVQLSGRNMPTLQEKFLKALPFSKAQKLGEQLEVPAKIVSGSCCLVDYLMSACWVMRRSILEQVGFLDEKIFYAPEDAEYCARVWKNGFQVAFCHHAVIVHSWQRVSKKSFFSRLNFEHVKGLIYFFSKYHCWISRKGFAKE